MVSGICDNRVFITYQALEIQSYLFFYFLAALGLHCSTRAFSSCSEQGLLSSCGVRASHCGGFSCCRAQALGHICFSSCSKGSVALLHVGSSQTRDWTRAPCIGKWTLNHWTTRDVYRIVPGVYHTVQRLCYCQALFCILVIHQEINRKTLPSSSRYGFTPVENRNWTSTSLMGRERKEESEKSNFQPQGNITPTVSVSSRPGCRTKAYK